VLCASDWLRALARPMRQNCRFKPRPSQHRPRISLSVRKNPFLEATPSRERTSARVERITVTGRSPPDSDRRHMLEIVNFANGVHSSANAVH